MKSDGMPTFFLFIAQCFSALFLLGYGDASKFCYNFFKRLFIK